jgi:MoaA/NifB/PqqE/SkfB family radical SAM enzyme
MKQPVDSKTFCVLPWIHVNASVGGMYRPCCNSEDYFPVKDDTVSIVDAFHGEEMQAIRQSMVQGEKHKYCDVCYVREDKGGLSFRHTYTADKFKQFVNADAEPVVKYLDMRFDSTCNLSCRMCDPSSSNQLIETIDWYKNNQQPLPNHWNKFSNYKNKNTEELSAKRKNYVIELLPTIEVFKITGGEPFISKDFIEVMDVAIERGYSKNIVLMITTNGTKFVDAILSRLRHFKGVDMNVSVDGHGDAYSYVRYPFKWDKWCERFEEFIAFADENKFYENPHFRMRTSTVITAYNWLSSPLLYTHLKSYADKYTWLRAINYIPRIDFNLNLRPVDSELSAKWLPESILNEGLVLWRETDYRQIKEFENYVKDAVKIDADKKASKNKELKYITTTLDRQRNQTYECLGPSITNWMNTIDG